MVGAFCSIYIIYLILDINECMFKGTKVYIIYYSSIYFRLVSLHR